jgi:tetratricopeptide (TPR) repeat protein
VLLVLLGGGAAAGWYFLLQPPRDVELLAGLKSPAAARAERTLIEGDPALVIQLLTEQPAALTGDSQAQLQLGNAYAARSEYARALDAYVHALELDAGLLADDRLRANLRLMIDDDGPILLEAARILAELGRDADARARIVELASARDRNMRRRAFGLAEQLGIADGIDRVKSFTLDLEQERTCAKRREAVTKLRALGDRRALAPLQQALERPPRSKGKRKRKRDRNACLRRHAEDAVRYLENVTPASPPEAAVSTTPTPG